MYDGNAFIKKYTEREPDRFEQEDDPDGSGCIRRKIVLASLNPEYEDIEIRANVPFSIVGQVLN